MTATTPTTPRLRRALGVGAVAVLVLSACGDDGADEAIDDAADQVSDADPEAEVEDAADEVDEAADEAADEAEAASAEVAQALRDNGLESIASAVELVDFSEVVDAPEFTFFAPNDEAFTSMTADELADLLADPEQVAEVLRNHAVAQKVAAADLSDGMQIDTEGGESLTVSIDGDTVMVGDATVVQPDIDVNDGVIHVVDRLIMP